MWWRGEVSALQKTGYPIFWHSDVDCSAAPKHGPFGVAFVLSRFDAY